jgi:hypothetical protein
METIFTFYKNGKPETKILPGNFPNALKALTTEVGQNIKIVAGRSRHIKP